MSGDDEEPTAVDDLNVVKLQEQLRILDEQLRRELRARGFDPDQDDNLALTAPLAKLYAERETLRSDLNQLTEVMDRTEGEDRKYERISE